MHSHNLRDLDIETLFNMQIRGTLDKHAEQNRVHSTATFTTGATHRASLTCVNLFIMGVRTLDVS